MNQDEKKTVIKKLQESSEAHLMLSSSFDRQSVTKCQSQIKMLLQKNPDATIVLIR